MRLALLTSRVIPHVEADVEQMVRTADALEGCGALDFRLVYASAPEVDAVATAAAIALTYGVRLGASRLHPVAPWIDTPAVFRAATSDRAAGPQWAADAAIARPLARALGSLAPGAALSRRWPLAAIASRLGIPTIYETHSPAHAGTMCRVGRAMGWRGIVAHSDYVRDRYVESGWPADSIRVIRNGYDPRALVVAGSKADARARLGLPAGAQIACYAGRLNAKKQPEMLIRAAAAMPEVTVVLVGVVGEHEQRALAAHAASHGACNVRIERRVEPSEAVDYLVAADVLLLTPASRPLASGRTVLPLKTYQYLGAGRPIVAPATPDVCEVLEHGRNAWLAPPDDPAATADAVRRVLLDAGLSERLVAGALATAPAFTWTARAKRLVTFIRERCAPVG
jgi:glycosyltransferase involved in cell wall biosynthesis